MTTQVDGWRDGWVAAGWLVGRSCSARWALTGSSLSPAWADDERMLVEPACGAALAAVYSGLLGRLQAEGRLRSPPAPVVVIVCGGNNINSRELQALKTQLGQS